MGDRELQRLARATVWRATELALLRAVSKHDGRLRDIELGLRRLRSLGCASDRLEVAQVRRMSEIHDEILLARAAARGKPFIIEWR